MKKKDNAALDANKRKVVEVKEDSLNMNESMEGNVEVLKELLSNPLIQAAVKIVKSTPFFNRSKWQREPGECIIFARCSNFNIKMWVKSFGKKVDHKTIFIQNDSTIQTSLYTLGKMLLDTKCKDSVTVKNSHLKSLKEAVRKYYALQEKNIKGSEIDLSKVETNNEGLKQLLKDMWGVNSAFKVHLGEDYITTQRLSKVAVLGLQTSLSQIKFSSNTEIFLTRTDQSLGVSLFRLFIPLESLREYVRSNPNIKGKFEFNMIGSNNEKSSTELRANFIYYWWSESKTLPERKTLVLPRVLGLTGLSNDREYVSSSDQTVGNYL